MKLLRLIAGVLCLSSVAQAQMGPAGPPGGGGGVVVPATGGSVLRYSGATPVTDVPAGIALTLVYVPSPAAAPYVQSVRFINVNTGAVMANMGATAVLMSPDPLNISVAAQGVGYGGGVIETTPAVRATWLPITKIKVVAQNAGVGTSITVVLELLDAKDRPMGPGARWRVTEGIHGFVKGGVYPNIFDDGLDRYGPYAILGGLPMLPQTQFAIESGDTDQYVFSGKFGMYYLFGDTWGFLDNVLPIEARATISSNQPTSFWKLIPQ